MFSAMRVAEAIALTSEEKETLSAWARERSLPARLVQRARVIQWAAEGRQTSRHSGGYPPYDSAPGYALEHPDHGQRTRSQRGQVERWFREITEKRIRRGTFKNVPVLVKAILAYIENHSQSPKVFVWSAPVGDSASGGAKCCRPKLTTCCQFGRFGIMVKVPLPQDELSILSRQVFTMNGLLLMGAKTVAASCGITVAQWHVLGRANYNPRTTADIARYIGISRQAVQRTADSLVEEGLLKYAPNPDHKRAQLATITAKGARVLESVYKADAVWSNNLLRQFEGIDLKAVIKVVDRIIPILSRNTGGRNEKA